MKDNGELESFPAGGLAVVIGASGGIGSALLEQLRNAPGFAHVLGLSRSGTPPLDLTVEDSIAAAAHDLAGRGNALRLVIDATGFLHGDGVMPEKSWQQLNARNMAKAFAINAIGPALLMKHFLPLLPTRGKSVFATLSAKVGSIGDNHLGGWYSYRASKAALNQLIRTGAVELKCRQPQAICVTLHPGTVESLLSAPFKRAGLDVQSPATAADRLLSVIGTLTSAASGGFFDYRGKALPW